MSSGNFYRMSFKKAPELLFLKATLDQASYRKDCKEEVETFFSKKEGSRFLKGLCEIYETDVVGIYFLIELNTVAYVGQSINVFNRAFRHKKDQLLPKKFDRVFTIKAPACILDFLESAFIGLLRPPLNGGKFLKIKEHSSDWGAKDQWAFNHPVEALKFCLDYFDGKMPDCKSVIELKEKFYDFVDPWDSFNGKEAEATCP